MEFIMKTLSENFAIIICVKKTKYNYYTLYTLRSQPVMHSKQLPPLHHNDSFHFCIQNASRDYRIIHVYIKQG